MSFILLRRDLSQNQIEDLPSKAFGNCHQLVYLHLDFNNMTELRNETFEGLRNLEDLILEHKREWPKGGTGGKTCRLDPTFHTRWRLG